MVNGNDPSMLYDTTEIASGFKTANHAYVVDARGNVWDPITNNWGDVEEKVYFHKIEFRNVDDKKVTLEND